MQNLRKTIVDMANQLQTELAGFESIETVLKEIVLEDGRIGQLTLKIELEPENFIEELAGIDTIYLNNWPVDGAERIVDERDRQLDRLGYDAERDDQYTDGQLAIAAACYAIDETSAKVTAGNGSDAWPLAVGRDKRDGLSRLRKLEIAGALIAAEIDREQRLIDAVKPAEES
jgi:hypothetical protein